MTGGVARGIVCCLMLGGAALGARAAEPGRLAAVVAGRPVTVRELAGWLRLRGIEPEKAGARSWQGALDAVIDRAVLAAAAEQEKVQVLDAEVTSAIAARRKGAGAGAYARRVALMGLGREQERRMMREQLLIERLLARKLGAKLFVAPGAVSAWYKKNKDLLAGPEVRVARVMTVEGEPKGAGAAGAKIKRLRERVLGGADFAKLARDSSAGPWAKKGGLLEPMEEGDSGPVFAERVFRLGKPGDMTEVFETDAGLHFLRLEEVRPGKVPSFKDAQEGIRRRLQAELRAKHVSELARELRRKTAVRVFWRHIPWRPKGGR